MTDQDSRNPETMTPAGRQAGSVVKSPVGRLVPVVGLWGGGAALIAIAIAWSRGLADSASFGAVTVIVAAIVGFGLLAALSPRPGSKWAFPVLGAQMVRTMLAPAMGLAVFLLVPVDAVAFWLTLLAVAAAMLAGETIAVAKMFGASTQVVSGQEAVA